MARISTRQLAKIFRRAGTALKAGLDARSVWEKETHRGPLGQRRHVEEIARRVAVGESIAAAMRETGGFFPSLACEMVDVGEQSGRVEDVLLRLADHYDQMLKLQRSFLFAIVWPALETLGAIVVIGLLLLGLWIVEGFTGSQAADILGLGLSIKWTFFLYVAGIVSCAVFAAGMVVGTQRGWLGAWPLTAATRIPVLGGTIQTMAVSRFAWSLGMAQDAGMDAAKSVRLALKSTQNPRYTAHLDEVETKIVHGQSIHDALAACGAFPADFLHTLETGEQSGTIAESMAHLADEYRSRAQAAWSVLAVVGGFLVMGLVAALIIFLIIRLFMVLYLGPIYDAMQPI